MAFSLIFHQTGIPADPFLQQIIDDSPLLSKSEERQLIQLAQQGDRKALDRLIRCNLRLIHKIAGKFAPFPVENEILVAEGMFSLMSVILDKFDLGKDTRLQTYAAWWLYDDMSRLALGSTGLSRYTHLLLVKINQASQSLQAELGREPSITEIADGCGLAIKQILKATEKQHQAQTLSTDMNVFDEITDPGDVWDFALDREFIDVVVPYVSHLSEREQAIFHAKYFEGFNNRQIGERVGVCKERVRQILINIEETLKGWIQGTSVLPGTEVVESTTPLNLLNEWFKDGLVKLINKTREETEKALQEFSQLDSINEDVIHSKADHSNLPWLDKREKAEFSWLSTYGDQLSSADQQCGQLGRSQQDCSGYSLKVHPVIHTLISLPLASVYQRIRGFQDNDKQPQRRLKMRLTSTIGFKALSLDCWQEQPRPPNFGLYFFLQRLWILLNQFIQVERIEQSNIPH